MLFDFPKHIYSLSLVAILLFSAPTALGQIREPDYSDWPEATRIDGRVIVSNGLQDFAGLERLLPRFVKSKNVVVITGDVKSEDTVWRRKLRSAIGSEGKFDVVDASFPAGVKLPTPMTVDSLPSLLGETFELLKQADCVLIESDATIPDPVLMNVIRRLDTVILEGSQGAKAGKISVKSVGVDLASSGWDLIPDTVITVADSGSKSVPEKRFLQFIASYGPLVGMVIPSDTAMMLSGRKITCFGSGKVTALVSKSEVTPQYRQQISERSTRRQAPSDYLIDLTQWRRLAMERELPQFPPAKPPVPNVENGTLLIVGGGGSPRGLMNRFVELAGGVDKAKLIYVPCAEEDEVSARQSMVSMWKRMGIKHATFIHTKDRNKADRDEEFLAPLKDATGIFFGGGRQWNFSDSYYGTTAHRLMKDVLKRGGVIAGSSAGASIQGRYLARATPIGNSDIMAPGYERGGLGFIGGVAIDQHFSQRGRQKDMVKLVQNYPQLLGIGLDEATAIEVQKSTAKVSGEGQVFFYSATSGNTSGEADIVETPFVALPAGAIYDLAKRTVVVDVTEALENEADGSGDG